MNILWVANVALPEACEIMGEKPSPFGGWMVNSSKILSKRDNITLSIAFPFAKADNVLTIKGEKITYYAFSLCTKYTKKCANTLINQLENILADCNPDLVHIYGTEYVHSYLMAKLCAKKQVKAVISIQGLISVITDHYLTGIPDGIAKRYTLRDLLRQDNLEQQKRKLSQRGLYEIEALRNVRHVIGRTTWDRACVSYINPHAKYHLCYEILREEFYKHRWSIDKCERYSIFISQGSYPVKGLHFVLEAMPRVLKEYPEAKLYVAGPDILKASSLKNLRRTSYTKYICQIIKKYNLEDKICFTGLLDEKQMCDRYLKSNVFVCPSTIENSPNSLGEAMILGLPCIASYVGGVPDMLKHKEEGFLYPVDEPYMLSYYICEVLKDSTIVTEFSNNARKSALKMYDPENNTSRMLDIYKNIIFE